MNSLKLFNLDVSPKTVKVRNLCDISISFSLDFELPKDSRLVFRFRGGRNNKNDWYLLQTEDPNANGYAQVKLSKPAKLIPLVITGKELLIKYLVCEPGGIKRETRIEFSVKNTLAQSLVEDRKKIEVLIEFPSEKPKSVKIPPVIDIINEKFDHLTIICPSIIAVNEKFKVLMRIEDKYKNLVKDFAEKIKLYEVTENNVKNLIVEVDFSESEEGLARLEGFSFSEPGIYYIEGWHDNQYFQSNPISCQEGKINNKLYWGYIHGHTNKSDGMRDLEEYFTNLFQDLKKLL